MRLLFALLLIAFALPAAAQTAYPIKADDGAIVANHRVPAETIGDIERLPGMVVVGNPKGDVTLAEFYDLNCPYCRKASADMAALLQEDKKLRLLLVPFPVLGIESIMAARVELAVTRLGTPEQAWQFHCKIFSGRGVIEGTRALGVARELGFAEDKLIAVANDDDVTDAMKAHVRLGNALKLQATPAYVIGDVAVLGHPGRKALRRSVEAMRRCGKAAC